MVTSSGEISIGSSGETAPAGKKRAANEKERLLRPMYPRHSRGAVACYAVRLISTKAGEHLRPRESGWDRKAACLPAHGMDHRFVRQPGRELGVRAGRTDVVETGFNERERAKGHDDRDRDHRPEDEVLQLLSTHGNPNAARENSL